MAEMRESLVPVPKTEPGFLIQEGEKITKKTMRKIGANNLPSVRYKRSR